MTKRSGGLKAKPSLLLVGLRSRFCLATKRSGSRSSLRSSPVQALADTKNGHGLFLAESTFGIILVGRQPFLFVAGSLDVGIVPLSSALHVLLKDQENVRHEKVSKKKHGITKGVTRQGGVNRALLEQLAYRNIFGTNLAALNLVLGIKDGH